MKKTFIIFLFVFNLWSDQKEIKEIKDDKSGRIYLRMPYTGVAPKLTLNPYEKQWEKWWSYQVCGYPTCGKLASECWFLNNAEEHIKREWTKTIISKEIPLRFVRLGTMGNPQGFALTTKSGKIIKIKTK